jgi:hypothetical protein
MINDDEWYEKIFDCPYGCELKRCPNYIVCGESLPEYVLDSSDGLCINCDVFWGAWRGGKKSLGEFPDTECPVCLEITTCVSQPKCNHHICPDCFKKCWFPSEPPQPKFPYPQDQEDEYDNNPDAEKWQDDPLIKKYHTDFRNWEISCEIRYDSNKNLRLCPICRA